MVEAKNKPKQKRTSMRWNKNTTRILVVIGLIILIASVIAWWQLIRNTPENTFNAMLENNFRTASVTRRVTQDNGAQKLDQIMRIQNQTKHLTHGKTKLTQGPGGRTVIVTESIGTPTVDYVRYASITTTQKGSKGQALNFGGVLNVWSRNQVTSEEQLGSLYQDATLGNLFLFADFSQAQRASMMNLIKENKVYDVNYQTAKKVTVNGRPKYAYQVAISPVAYITMIKQFSEDIGLTQLRNLDPSNYKNAAPVKFQILVDIISQRLDSVKTGSGANTQEFSGYGIIEDIQIPTNAVPATELQQRLTQSASV